MLWQIVSDVPLWGVAAVFCGLSFLMAWVIDKLPVWCQSSWFIISVWGIFWINFAYGVIHPEAWVHIYKIAVIFLASLPGMMLLDYLQKQSMVSYWEREGLPEGMTGRVVYLSDLVDRFVWWWTRRKINDNFQDLDYLFSERDYPDDNSVYIDKRVE